MAYGTGSHIPGWNPPPKPQGNDPYKASIIQGGQDYDDIMARYRAILNRGPDKNQSALQGFYGNLINGPKYTPTPMAGTPYVHKNLQYKRGPEMDAAFANLKEYSRTGGISDAEGRDIRARGVSPIRSVYSNAQQNLDRSRALGGGYSPNYAASSAKMTRDLADSVGNATTNVEAGLADQRQQGRLAMAPQYAEFAQRETGMMGDINSRNEDNRLRAESFNTDNRFRDEDNRLRAAEMSRATQGMGAQGLMGLYGNQRDREMEALRGMQGMYGSAPGMAGLYGQQAFQRRGLDQQDQQMNNQSSRDLMSAYGNRRQTRQPFRLG